MPIASLDASHAETTPPLTSGCINDGVIQLGSLAPRLVTVWSLCVFDTLLIQ